MLQYRKYSRPESIQELFALMEQNKDSFDLLSGGTDVYAKEAGSGKLAECAIDISAIEAFSNISRSGNSITIGANTRVQQFLEDAVLIECVPIVRHAAIYFADQQIREAASVGGNLANASPSGDLIAPMAALDAVVHTLYQDESGIHEKDYRIMEFILSPKKTAMEKRACIASVTCPILSGYGCAFKKVGLRRSLCISTVNSAFLVKPDADSRSFADVRIAFGGIGPTPTRLYECEAYLKGKPICREVIDAAAEFIPADVVRSRSRREYRAIVVRNFFFAGLSEALAETGVEL